MQKGKDLTFVISNFELHLKKNLKENLEVNCLIRGEGMEWRVWVGWDAGAISCLFMPNELSVSAVLLSGNQSGRTSKPSFWFSLHPSSELNTVDRKSQNKVLCSALFLLVYIFFLTRSFFCCCYPCIVCLCYQKKNFFFAYFLVRLAKLEIWRRRKKYEEQVCIALRIGKHHILGGKTEN